MASVYTNLFFKPFTGFGTFEDLLLPCDNWPFLFLPHEYTRFIYFSSIYLNILYKIVILHKSNFQKTHLFANLTQYIVIRIQIPLQYQVIISLKLEKLLIFIHIIFVWKYPFKLSYQIYLSYLSCKTLLRIQKALSKYLDLVFVNSY